MSHIPNPETLIAAIATICQTLNTQNNTLTALTQALVQCQSVAAGTAQLAAVTPPENLQASVTAVTLPSAPTSSPVNACKPPRAAEAAEPSKADESPASVTVDADEAGAATVGTASVGLTAALLARACILDGKPAQAPLATLTGAGLRFMALAAVYLHAGISTATIGDLLARAYGLDGTAAKVVKRALPKAVDRAEKAGLLNSERATDGRSKIWVLSEKGFEWLVGKADGTL